MDLRLIEVFLAVYRTRSVSRAAETLGLAQPTVSIALAKLRREFGDVLFVRTTSGMQPTPRATAAFAPVAAAMSALSDAVQSRAAFDPNTIRRLFRVSVSDSSQMVLIPRLLSQLRRRAPGVTLELSPIAADAPRQLEGGQIDLAIGALPQLGAGFMQQRLFHQGFVCLVRKNHPRILGETITLEQFAAEAHIRVPVAGAGSGFELLQKRLARQGLMLQVAVSQSTFLGVALVVASTDLVATVPEQLGRTLAKENSKRVRLVAPPFKWSPYTVRQYWHERFHGDPPNRWLRSLVAELFSEIEPQPPAASVGRARSTVDGPI
jgi:DNA-binding transcriptional LysR family regulator